MPPLLGMKPVTHEVQVDELMQVRQLVMYEMQVLQIPLSEKYPLMHLHILGVTLVSRDLKVGEVPSQVKHLVLSQVKQLPVCIPQVEQYFFTFAYYRPGQLVTQVVPVPGKGTYLVGLAVHASVQINNCYRFAPMILRLKLGLTRGVATLSVFMMSIF